MTLEFIYITVMFNTLLLAKWLSSVPILD